MGGYLRVVCTFMVLAFAATPALAQTTGVGAPAQGIGLTADHKRTIYPEVRDEPAREVPNGSANGSTLAIGAEIPDSMM